MKKILSLFCFFTISLIFSQQIEVRDNKYYVNDALVYKHEITKTLAANPEALQLYKKSRTKESVGGLLLGGGIGLIIGDVVKGLVSDVDYPSGFTYVGAGLIGVSIPVLSGRTRMRTKSIELYNESVKDNSNSLGYQFDMKVITNSNGIGLNITF
ncbi:MAG: hypothetical protein CMP76_11695 [Flavobacterium sp.]|uniref:hypothetical protein n=1 Tax=Flavobacterium sp. TaxID=239 RepID=UPI000C437B53|nr:hypothetical protein [Flavobacterium sp.]MBF03948.1 hypothetical protein [Flavobacterium sp.]|tara:strand:- start:49 stop:513 length:465 start_codon:yes stop_codon:yes gene_type:complete